MALGTGRGQQAVEISIAFTVLALFVVALRLYSRIFIARHHALEDYFISLAFLCSSAFTICICVQAKYGLGKHLIDVPEDEGIKSLKAFYASLIVYYLSLGFTKSSILIQYLRLFPTKKFQTSCWSILGVVVAYTVYTLFANIFICLPPRAFWTHEHPAKCINQFAYWFTNAAINILTDFAIIILPMPVIRQLNLPRRQKQALLGVFAVGGLVCVVSIIRLHSLIAISNSTDPTYTNPPAASWTSVEVNVGIICSCLPLLKPLMARCLPHIFSDANKRSGNNTPRWTPGPSYRLGRHTQEDITMKSSKSTNSKGKTWADSRNIEVVTDIQVDIEGGRTPRGGWNFPAPPSPALQTKERHTDRSGSTDTLVTDRINVL